MRSAAGWSSKKSLGRRSRLESFRGGLSGLSLGRGGAIATGRWTLLRKLADASGNGPATLAGDSNHGDRANYRRRTGGVCSRHRYTGRPSPRFVVGGTQALLFP